jgi:AsmA family protein
MRLSTIAKIVAALVLVLVVAVIAAGKSMNSAVYNAFLAERVKAATGLDLAFAGQTKLKLAASPVLSFTGVTLSAGKGAEILYIDRIEAQVPLVPLALRQLRIESATFFRPVLHPENFARIKPGTALSLLGAPSGAPDTQAALSELRVEDATIVLAGGRPLAVKKALFRPEIDGSGTLAVQAKGEWLGAPLEVTGAIGPLALIGGAKPYPVQLKLSLDNANLSLRGTLAAPLVGTGLDFDLKAQGEELSALLRLATGKPPALPLGPFKIAAKISDSAGPLALSDLDAVIGHKETLLITAKGRVADLAKAAGVEVILGMEADTLDRAGQLIDPDLPNAGPLKLTAHLGDIDQGWRLTGMKSTIAHSDLAGELSLVQGPHPRIYGRLAASLLDLDDFSLPLVKGADRLHAAQPQRPAIPIADGSIFSLTPLPVDGLRQLDVDLSVTAARLRFRNTVLSDAAAEIRAAGGRATISDFNAGAGQGRLSGDLSLDVTPKTPLIALHLQGKELDSAPLTGGLISDSKADLAVDLRVQGASPRAMAGTATGNLFFAVGPSRLAVQAKGELLSILADQIDAEAVTGSTLSVKCLAANLPVKGGLIAMDRAVGIETPNAAALAFGRIDLRTEDLSVVVARRGTNPLRMRGTLGAALVESDGAAKAQADATPCRAVLARRH